MGLKLVTPPADDPVTLAEAKAQLSVDFDDDDALIALLIKAATQALEGKCGRAFKPQVWDYYLDAFPCNGNVRLPLAPVISVDSVNYVDPNTEMETVLSVGNYEVDTASEFGWIAPATSGWPTPATTINAIRIRFTAGYPDSDDSPPVTTVPDSIRQAILIWVRDLYDNRGSVVVGAPVQSIPDAVDRLIDPYRIIARWM